MLRRIALIFTFAALATSVASADILPFSWSTTGSFSSTLGFSGVSAGAPVSTDLGGNLSDIFLGTISMPNVDANSQGTFSLTVTFVQPDGSADPAYSAPFTVTANVNGINDRLVIDFPAATTLNFDGTDGKGWFTFDIPDVNVRLDGNIIRTYELRGNIRGATLDAATAQVAPVPEPGSILLLGTALGGLALTLRRRKRG